MAATSPNSLGGSRALTVPLQEERHSTSSVEQRKDVVSPSNVRAKERQEEQNQHPNRAKEGREIARDEGSLEAQDELSKLVPVLFVLLKSLLKCFT